MVSPSSLQINLISFTFFRLVSLGKRSEYLYFTLYNQHLTKHRL